MSFFICYDKNRWYLHNNLEVANGSFIPREWMGTYEDERRAIRHVHLLNRFNVNPLTYDLRLVRERQRAEAILGIDLGW